MLLMHAAPRDRRRQVVLVGLNGKQATALRRRIGGIADLKILTTDRSLKFRGSQADAVFVTRFISHKHEWRLRRVSTCPVISVRTAGVEAFARAVETLLAAA